MTRTFSFGYAAENARASAVRAGFGCQESDCTEAEFDSAARIAASNGAGLGATNNVNALDAAFEGALCGFEFEDHAPGDGSILDQGFDFLLGDGGDDFFAVENAGDVGEIDQLIGAEIFGASGGHVVGVDVVELIVGADAEARGDGNEIAAPERFDEVGVYAGEIADEAEAADDFVVNERLGAEGIARRLRKSRWRAGQRQKLRRRVVC